MVEEGHAQAVMGNHEYNAILYNIKSDDGYLRPHNEKNNKQHGKTLEQYKGLQKEYNESIKWFKTLPLFIETDKFRVVHASWNQKSIDYFKKYTDAGRLTEEQFVQSAKKIVDQFTLFDAVEITCKGLEATLPDGGNFQDKGGHTRHEIRVRWWEDPANKTFKEMSVQQDIEIKETPFKVDLDFYKPDNKPVFFGHYWLEDNPPTLRKDNVCCLDFSVAKNGLLCAYRWDGESELNDSNFIFV